MSNLDNELDRVKLEGGTDSALIGNIGDSLKVTLASGFGGGGSFPSNIFKQGELAVGARSETDLTGVTYTVPSGKTFALKTFTAALDAPALMVVRLKKQTGGAGPFNQIFKIVMMNGGQGDATPSMPLCDGIIVGSAGDVFKVTFDPSSSNKGTLWAEFSGVEY